jgi:hypothetical protein
MRTSPQIVGRIEIGPALAPIETPEQLVAPAPAMFHFFLETLHKNLSVKPFETRYFSFVTQ